MAVVDVKPKTHKEVNRIRDVIKKIDLDKRLAHNQDITILCGMAALQDAIKENPNCIYEFAFRGMFSLTETKETEAESQGAA